MNLTHRRARSWFAGWLLGVGWLLCKPQAPAGSLVNPPTFKFQVLARTGGTTPRGNAITWLGTGPSINDDGRVAYALRIADGREGVYISGDTNSRSSLIETFQVKGATFSGLSANFIFPNAVQLNNRDQVTWQSRSRDGLFCFLFRLGSSAADFRVVAKTRYDRIDNVPGELDSPFCGPFPVPWTGLSEWPSLNNAGRVVFGAQLCDDPGLFVIATPVEPEGFRHDDLGDFHLSEPLRNFTNAFPLVADNAATVVRGGRTMTAPILVFRDENLSVGDATFVAATGGDGDFDALGERPGISDDGRVVAFMGDHKSTDAGIYYAVLDADNQLLQPPEKATDTVPFSAFVDRARVGVNRVRRDDPSRYALSYLAFGASDVSGTAGPLGLYLTVIDLADPSNPQPSPAHLVLRVGDPIPDSPDFPEPITSIALYDPINNNSEMAVWVTTANTQAILKIGFEEGECQTCAQTTPAPMCPIGATRFENNSVDIAVSLGSGPGESDAFLRVKSKIPTPLLTSPRSLAVSAPLKGFTRVLGASGLRQVRGPRFLADVAVLGPKAYEIRLHTNAGPRNATTGLFPPTGNPATVIRFENPDGTGGTNRLRISKDGRETALYTFDPATKGWELVTGFASALRRERLDESPAGNRRTQTRTIRDALGAVIARTIDVYQSFAWGEELVETTEGLAPQTRTTLYRYYTNQVDGLNYRHLRSIRRSHGAWEYFAEYGSRGIRRSVRQFLDHPYSETAVWPDPANRSTEVTYAGELETTTEYLAGRLVARRWHHVVSPGEIWDAVAVHPDIIAWNHPSNLIVRTFTYQDSDNVGARLGRIAGIRNADGTATLYRYYRETIPDPTHGGSGPAPRIDVNRTVTLTGELDASGTRIVTGQRTEVVEDLLGSFISRREYDITSNLLVDSEVAVERDFAGRTTRSVYLDGTYSTLEYDCCDLQSESDRDGVTTAYNPDRVILLDLDRDRTNEVYSGTSVTRAGVTTHEIQDGLGRSLMSVLQGTNGALIIRETRQYNVLGDLQVSRDALGRVTTYDETLRDGLLVRTTTFPDGGVQIESSYPDGSHYESRGSAVAPVRYSFGVVEKQGVWMQVETQTRLEKDGSLSPEYTTSTSDFAGRLVQTEYPWPDGAGPAIETREYNRLGQLVRSADPDGFATLYTYNGRGEPETTALDVANPGVIDPGGSDRITRTTTRVRHSPVRGGVVRETITEVWETNNLNQASVLGIVETRVDGTQSWQTQYGLTSHSDRTVDRARQRRTVTTTYPDGTASVSVSEQGRQVSVSRLDAKGDRVSGKTFEYDAFGRLQSEIDARNGPTTYSYDDVGQIQSVTTPDPDPTASGPGQDPQTTRYTYYRDPANGTKTVITHPDGAVVTQEFYPDGQIRRTWGARTYPVEYTYDRAGRMETLTTWQDFDLDAGVGRSGSATTRWNYNARGLLAGKQYADGKGPTYTYTAGGRLRSRVWARGVRTTYEYDPRAGDLLTVTYSDATPGVTNVYDRLGRVQTVIDAVGRRTLAYRHGQQVAEVHDSGLLAGIAVEQALDSLDRPSSQSVQNPTGIVYRATYGYDDASRLQSVTSGAVGALYTYHADSDSVQTVTHTYNGAPRLTTTKAIDRLGRLRSVAGVPSADGPVQFTYQYNEANQRIAAALANGESWTYAYDALGQVTNGVKRLPNRDPLPGYQFGYRFDDIGNRLAAYRGQRTDSYTNNTLNQIRTVDFAPWLHVLGLAHSNAAVTVNDQPALRAGGYFYSEIPATNDWQEVHVQARLPETDPGRLPPIAEETGHLTAHHGPENLHYDDDGNLLSDGRWTYTWDAENRVIRKETDASLSSEAQRRLEYALDSGGRRVRVRVSDGNSGRWTARSDRKFVYRDLEMLAELDSTTGTELRSYLWGLDLSNTRSGAGGVGGLLAVTIDSSSHFPAYDGNGNVSALVDAATGTLSAVYEYDPFGNTLRLSGPAAQRNPLRFSTKFAEESTSDIHYEYRDYAPRIGRWPNRDPIGELGAINLYAFLDNDPLNWFDYLGMAGSICCAEKIEIKNIKKLDSKSQWGHEFDAVIDLKYLDGKGETADCQLIWNETTDLPAIPGHKPNEKTDMYSLYPQSPTFQPWKDRKKPTPGSEQVVIHDPPALGKRPGRNATRTLKFEIIVKSGKAKGCSCDKESVTVTATQYLEMKNGEGHAESFKTP